jgi:hypothetical protein
MMPRLHQLRMVSPTCPSGGFAAVFVSGVALAFGSLLAGCGSSSDSARPAVPGGAPVEARSGTPEYCSALVASSPVRELGDALGELAEVPPSSGAVAHVRGAAQAFATIGQKAGGRLARAFTSAAVALQALATRGMTDHAAVDQVDHALNRLGRETQGKCAFPVS